MKERQDAIKAIVDAGHLPSGMEGFPAIDMEQFEYIKKVIDQCDYYVLIVGDRYGSVAPDGMSFTEKEYRYAVETKQVVLAFVKETQDEGTQDEKLVAFKAKVMTGRLVHQWKDGEDLKYPVRKSLQEAFDQQPRVGWSRANGSASQSQARRWPWLTLGAILIFVGGSVFGIRMEHAMQNRDQQLASTSPPKERPTPVEPQIPLVFPSPPKSNLSATEIATKIGVWTSINRQMDDLAKLLNRGYPMHDTWLADVRSDRGTEIKNIEALGASFEIFRAKLDKLRELYVNDTDIATALRPVALPPGRPLPPYTIFRSLNNSIDALASELRGVNDPVPENIEATMFSFTGALKRSLDAMRDWQGEVRKAAAEQETFLSRVEPPSQNSIVIAPIAAKPTPSNTTKLGRTGWFNLFNGLTQPGQLQQLSGWFVIITAPPENAEAEKELNSLFYLSTTGSKALRPTGPPDHSKDLDAPRLEGKALRGITIHGRNQAADFIAAALQNCFVVLRTAEIPAGLFDYYHRQSPTVFAEDKFVWLEIGNGSPWTGNCRD